MKITAWISVAGLIILGGAGYFMFTEEKEAPAPILPVTQNAAPPAVVNIAPPVTSKKEIPQIPKQQTMPLSITSTAFSANGSIPARFTCDGKNISPELIFANIPDGTQSLALTLEDPDVPRSIRADGMWDHWVVWNMPATTTRLGEGATPPGVLGKGTNGKVSYLGPCPPDREHRYFFTLYALDATLSLPRGATKEELLQALASHLIEKAILVGRYNRK